MKTVTHPGTAPFGVAIALGFLTLLGPTSIDMYLPSLPVMANELGTDYTTMQFTLTVFLLAMGGGQLIFGPIIDALGRRGPLLTAIIIFVFTSVWSAWASTHESLIIARFFSGAGCILGNRNGHEQCSGCRRGRSCDTDFRTSNDHSGSRSSFCASNWWTYWRSIWLARYFSNLSRTWHSGIDQ
jgi:hypothetical protein